MGAFDQILTVMWDMGLNLFFPWLVILAVTYGLLNKYEVISEEDGVNGAIAIGVAFLGVLGLSGTSGIFTSFAAAITFGVFGVLGLMVLMAVAGYDITEHSEDSTSGFAVFAGLIGLISFMAVAFNFIDFQRWIPSDASVFQDAIMPVLILVFLFLVIAVTVRE
ncbi:MAG: hypothetical protein BRC30_03750 [Nanohaloarchaea archaeon SW_7_46_7]|nr:MAG: hypothetical protein BRC30_03750 [Nanohaloarchaea archaeon SW_7_46_7]